MADAADSKSAAHKACGFKSRHPHFLFNNNYYSHRIVRHHKYRKDYYVPAVFYYAERRSA